MSNIHAERIGAKVAAVNAANKFVNDNFNRYSDALRPFVGKKILKVDETLIKAVADVINLPTPENIRVVRNKSKYSLSLCVSATERCIVCTEYSNAYMYLGDINEGILERLSSHDDLKCDYTVEYVNKIKKEVGELERQLEDKKDLVRSF